MRRKIVSFSQDELGDWIAALECLHTQHVRHRPPWQERPWVKTAEGRSGRIGSEIECPLCDRAELPEGLSVVRRAGPWDAGTLPTALTRDHRIAAGRWGCLRVLEGSVRFEMGGTAQELAAGDDQPIPPQVEHRVTPIGNARLEVLFLAR